MSVLVVETDPFDRDAIIGCLRQSWPFEQMPQIHTATDGVEAWDRIRQQAPALVLLNWKLPRNSAGDVLAQLRQSGYATPAIVMDGCAERDLPVNLKQLGAAYLHKDELTMTAMFSAIVEAMRRARRWVPPATGAPDRPEIAR
jgi:CheY-like chemotaxis protein